MISKPDEKVTRKGNYRKTSIINAKTLNKVLANQIQEHIKRIIYNDPVECIHGMQGWFDIQKLSNTIQYIKTMKEAKTRNLLN